MSSKRQARNPARTPGAAGAQNQHNDWGHAQAGAEGNAQSGGRGNASNIGGLPGGQHNDWGHSPVETAGSAESAAAAGRKRQGVMPGEEMGHLRGQLRRRHGDK